MIKRLLIAIVLLGMIATVGMALYLRDQLTQPLSLTEATLYQVEDGASLKRVLNDFQKRGWLSEPRLHEYWLRLTDQTAIQRGEYRLQPNETPSDVVARMVAGDKVMRSVQFIEGWNFRQIRAALAAQEHLQQTLPELSDPAVAELLGIDHSNPEGWFFPDTYLFERGLADTEVLRRSYQKMQAELERAWAMRSELRAIETPYEALILASIIEKETGAAFERPQISGVFSRRLQQGMRLQTDPTVIYGLGDSYNGNLTRDNLRRDNPYNTYRRGGLPPTPIASPGRGALEAAVNPDDGLALYFVAKGDGTHLFSATYEEHQAAVRQYQRFGRRRDDYRSAPPPDETPAEEATQ
ncbi:endolytic transglycosylase MltG [Saccharospirillum mangrovi]|uniref:endolytic transglycosylase MltG n=1 Tax=Saccharospirillum mangrovi TaxID=2161747 RepID=UPI0018E53BD4|nr:endolytic transglycosylase MltG [Saccharospirillum mangrovi]